jgi:hypothetical protein
MLQSYLYILFGKPVCHAFPNQISSKTPVNYLKRYRFSSLYPGATIMLLWLFFLPFRCTAALNLEGKVVCIQSGLPLDSVRVASTNYQSVTVTHSDGLYILERNIVRNCLPQTLSVDSFDEFSLHISSPKQRKTLISRRDGPVAATIFDLKGRVVVQTTLGKSTQFFDNDAMSSGIYILKATGLNPQKFIIAGNNSRNSINWKQRTIMNIVYPQCSTSDTIYFCKEGYSVFAATAEYLSSHTTISLAKKRWIASDNHNHTVLTDGSFIQDSVLTHAFAEGGLDVFVNSEHGGKYYYDTSGLQIGSSSIPRWYTVAKYSWPKILGQRKKFPDKVIMQGIEWNCPGHEHASVGFVNDTDQPSAISDFEYQFDFNDDDTSRPFLQKQNGYLHSNAITGLKWLQDRYPASSYFFANHPSREAIGKYTVADLRDFHNAAPDVCLGFEGMPGHHKDPYRGSYGYTVLPQNRTWGGADYDIACIGGIWDALLGEGRHFRIIANSDFHSTAPDFWPGVYEKTWTAVTDSGGQAWLNGLKAGEIFIAHGDLIKELDFSLDDGICCAPMGSDLLARKDSLVLTIRFKSPAVNNNGDSVRVDHVDLIRGSINGKISSSDRVAYNNPSNPSTEMVQRFTATDWITENGYKVIRTTISCTKPSYFRLRGTSLAVGTPNEVDKSGNPLMDIDGINNESVAWKDIWFYSNPIFVYTK